MTADQLATLADLERVVRKECVYCHGERTCGTCQGTGYYECRRWELGGAPAAADYWYLRAMRAEEMLGRYMPQGQEGEP